MTRSVAGSIIPTCPSPNPTIAMKGSPESSHPKKPTHSKKISLTWKKKRTLSLATTPMNGKQHVVQHKDPPLFIEFEKQYNQKDTSFPNCQVYPRLTDITISHRS